MRILAFDASTPVCSVALYADGAVQERSATGVREHTEQLLPLAAALLAHAGVGKSALDAIAFASGPGSFTGVRIACGIAQGMAYGLNLQVVPVPTLLALAAASGHDQVIAALDARMDEIYHAAYRREGEAWVCVSAPRVCAAQDAPRVPGGGWFGAGSGFAAYGAALLSRYAGALSGSDATLEPRAGAIARLAAAAYARGEHHAAELALPTYLRDKVALTSAEQARLRA